MFSPLHPIRPWRSISVVLLAVPLLALLGQATAKTPDQQPAIGLSIVGLTPESATVYGIADGRGALVVGLVPGAPADLAGIALGDVVRSLAGRGTDDADELVAILDQQQAGGTVRIALRRNGADRALSLKLIDAAALARLQPPGSIEARFTEAMAAFERHDTRLAWSLNEELGRRGHSGAQNLLGIMNSVDFGAPLDPVRANWWFRLAAQQGEASAQNNLAWQYWNGVGLPVDKQRAWYWMARAAKAGNPDSIAARDEMLAGLSPTEKTTAQAWLDWVPAAKPVKIVPSISLVRSIQRDLARLGYDVGAADGVAGRRTVAAVKSFQRKAGLSVDGAITEGLRDALANQPTPAEAKPKPAKPKPDTAPRSLGELGFPEGDLEIEE